MGCISSKVMSRTRSMSFQEELNQSFQMKSNGTNQFLTLVCTANTKLHNGSFTIPSNTSPKPSIEPTYTDTINTSELMAGLEEQVEQKHAFNKTRRSKSCQLSPFENLASSPITKNEETTLNEGEFNKGGIVRSRSFHTVEEYDAMVQNLLGSRKIVLDDKSTMQLQPLKSSSIKEILKDDDLKDTTQILPSNFNDDDQEKRIEFDKGLKRKTMAKGLESLKIPPAVEFPRAKNLMKLVQQDQFYSPGAYVTPKFGSYNLPNHGLEKKCREEESIFNPELVAAFEESMLQLEVEEEFILKQIEDAAVEKKEPKEFIEFNLVECGMKG